MIKKGLWRLNYFEGKERSYLVQDLKTFGSIVSGNIIAQYPNCTVVDGAFKLLDAPKEFRLVRVPYTVIRVSDDVEIAVILERTDSDREKNEPELSKMFISGLESPKVNFPTLITQCGNLSLQLLKEFFKI